MNLYYQTLQLPANPLKDPNDPRFNLIKEFEPFDPNILTDELLAIFEKINVKVKCCIVFSRQDNKSHASNRVLHTDLNATVVNGKFEWKKIICGVNWELNNNTNEFAWYDTTGIPESYPPFQGTKDITLNGIHYGSRRQQGVYPGSTKLASTEIKQPTLVRTDVAHLITYNNTAPVFRRSLSVRFEETWNSWEEAMEAFSPISI
jgi:hypothetical protein